MFLFVVCGDKEEQETSWYWTDTGDWAYTRWSIRACMRSGLVAAESVNIQHVSEAKVQVELIKRIWIIQAEYESI